MSPEDKTELRRLADMLRDVEAKLEPDSPLREGLFTAHFALDYIFTKGLRTDFEQSYPKGPGKPLTEAEVARLNAEIARLKNLSNDPEP
jgi:hypothetical protein